MAAMEVGLGGATEVQQIVAQLQAVTQEVSNNRGTLKALNDKLQQFEATLGSGLKEFDDRVTDEVNKLNDRANKAEQHMSTLKEGMDGMALEARKQVEQTQLEYEKANK